MIDPNRCARGCAPCWAPSAVEPPKRDLGLQKPKDFFMSEALGFLLLNIVKESLCVLAKNEECCFEEFAQRNKCVTKTSPPCLASLVHAEKRYADLDIFLG